MNEFEFDWHFCDYCGVDHLAVENFPDCKMEDLKKEITRLKGVIDTKDNDIKELKKKIPEEK